MCREINMSITFSSCPKYYDSTKKKKKKKKKKTCNVKRLSVDQELFNCNTWDVEQEL